MADDGSDEDLARLVGDLVRTLRELESELEPPEPGERPPLPTPRDLRRFTSEVAIPGLVLVLETNIRALRLLQRALRLADGADAAREETSRIQDHARSVSESSLERLDDALVDIREAIEGRPDEAEAAELLDQARELRAEVQQRLRESRNEKGSGETGGKAVEEGETEAKDDDSAAETAGDGTVESDPSPVDVDAELRTIKSELEDTDGPGESDGADSGHESDDHPDSDSSADDHPDSDSSDDDSPADRRGDGE
mgnify:CR=1 FL=1